MRVMVQLGGEEKRVPGCCSANHCDAQGSLHITHPQNSCVGNPRKRSPPEVPRAAAFISEKARPFSNRSLLTDPERCWYCHPVVLVSQRLGHFSRRNRCLKPCSDYIGSA